MIIIYGLIINPHYDQLDTEYRSITVRDKRDPVDFFPPHSENLALPVPGETFNFPRAVCGFPSATFICPTKFNIICPCFKRAKQRPDRQWQLGGKFRPGDVFAENLVRI